MLIIRKEDVFCESEYYSCCKIKNIKITGQLNAFVFLNSHKYSILYFLDMFLFCFNFYKPFCTRSFKRIHFYDNYCNLTVIIKRKVYYNT